MPAALYYHCIVHEEVFYFDLTIAELENIWLRKDNVLSFHSMSNPFVRLTIKYNDWEDHRLINRERFSTREFATIAWCFLRVSHTSNTDERNIRLRFERKCLSKISKSQLKGFLLDIMEYRYRRLTNVEYVRQLIEEESNWWKKEIDWEEYGKMWVYLNGFTVVSHCRKSREQMFDGFNEICRLFWR